MTWEAVFARLQSLRDDPQQTAGDGCEAASVSAVDLAIANYNATFEHNPPPDYVIVDPNGGLVFERNDPHCRLVWHFWDDGGISFIRFDNDGKIKQRIDSPEVIATHIHG